MQPVSIARVGNSNQNHSFNVALLLAHPFTPSQHYSPPSLLLIVFVVFFLPSKPHLLSFRSSLLINGFVWHTKKKLKLFTLQMHLIFISYMFHVLKAAYKNINFIYSFLVRTLNNYKCLMVSHCHAVDGHLSF